MNFRAPGVVEAYEKLFYNVRDDKGLLCQSPWIREYFAFQGAAPTANINRNSVHEWKMVAFEGGYELLRSIWSWPSATGDYLTIPESLYYATVFRKSFRTLMLRLHNETIDGRALADITKQVTEIFADLRDRGILSKEESLSDNTLFAKMLQLMAPEMSQVTSGRLEEMQSELDNKVAVIKTTDLGGADGSMGRIAAQIAEGT